MRVRPDAIKVTTNKFKFTQDKMALRHKILNECLIPLRRLALVLQIEDSCIIYQVHINLKKGAWVPMPIRHSDSSPESFGNCKVNLSLHTYCHLNCFLTVRFHLKLQSTA
jgi:hypothetical protein